MFAGNVSVTSFLEDGEYSSMDARVKQTAEQQRTLLRMLEKSLAREQELEKRLADSKHDKKELELKLQHVEGEMFCMEEMSDLALERFFEAENIAEVLTGILKGLMEKLQISWFSLNSAQQQEADMSLKLQSSMQELSAGRSALQKLKTCCSELDNLKTLLMEAEDRSCLASFEVVSLRENIDSLEAQLRESKSQLQQANASVEASQEEQKRLSSKITDLENLLEELKSNVSKADSRAQSAESNCKLLAETNSGLNKELRLHSSDSIEKVNFLEKQLRQSDTQLQHERASNEAIREEQTMLYSSLHDMENLIEDLKAKALKAEHRAENAEANCIQLTDRKLELNEELGFLRGRIKHLEESLQKAEDGKLATAKDIGMRTRVITDLVMQLAMERERLRLQVITFYFCAFT